MAAHAKWINSVSFSLRNSVFRHHTQKLLDQSCQLHITRDDNVFAKRHFFKSVRAAVSYYYDVIIQTGNRFGAGTDANVFLEIYGERGSSGEIHLPSKKGDLERGMVNRYKVAAKDLGALKNIDVRHDNTGLAPGWYLEKVTIKDHSGSRYVFSCEDWLVKQAGENKLKAHLSLSEQNLDQLPSYRGKKLEYMKLDDKEHLDAVEETVHKNLSNVLEGILQSSLEPDADSVSEFPNSELETPDNNDGLKHTAQSLLPSARLLIEAFGLIKGQIPASGPKGHLLKGDVLKYIELNKLTRLPLENSHTDQKKASNVQQKATKAAATTTKVKDKVPKSGVGSAFEDHPVTDDTKAKLQWYLKSKQTQPHFYSSIVCNLNSIISICKELSQQGSSITTTSFVLKAVSSALKQIPEMNAKYVNETIKVVENVDVAVTLNSLQGSCRGLIKGLHQRTLEDIQKSLEDLKLNDSGHFYDDAGSFAVTDLSDGGLSQSSEIIRPEHACVLTIGSPKLSLSENESLLNLSTVTVSCDGRVVSEDTISKFLNVFKKLIENPNAYL